MKNHEERLKEGTPRFEKELLKMGKNATIRIQAECNREKRTLSDGRCPKR